MYIVIDGANTDMTTFGIEIEITNDGNVTQSQIADAITANGVRCNVENYTHNTPRNWKVVTDASCGFEVVSPVLDPRNGDGCWTEIMAVCNALNSLGVKVNKNCGLHVHLYVANMNPRNVAAFVAKYVRNEHFIDLAMPKSRRLSNNRFCRSNIGATVSTDPTAYMAQVNEWLVLTDTKRIHAAKCGPSEPHTPVIIDLRRVLPDSPGTFPDVMRIIDPLKPIKTTPVQYAIDPKYLADALHLSRSVIVRGDSKSKPLFFEPNIPTGGEDERDWFAVVMPMAPAHPVFNEFEATEVTQNS